MTETVLQTQKLTKTYGKGASAFTALRGINLDVKQGETLAIIGKSGSGKSTLMHLLALLDSPTEGAVLVEGKHAAHFRRRKIDALRNHEFGFVFQQFFLNANDSVLNNVTLPLKIAGIGARERKRRGLEVLKAVDLDEKAGNKAKDLSGGQKQRVVIARAVINNPKVIFADEPTGNLDSATGQKIEDLLFKLNRDKDITLIFVTHDTDLAKRCQRQIHIKDGLIEKVIGGKKS